MDLFRTTGLVSDPNIEVNSSNFCYDRCALYLRKIELLFKENVYFKILQLVAIVWIKGNIFETFLNEDSNSVEDATFYVFHSFNERKTMTHESGVWEGCLREHLAAEFSVTIETER